MTVSNLVDTWLSACNSNLLLYSYLFVIFDGYFKVSKQVIDITQIATGPSQSIFLSKTTDQLEILPEIIQHRYIT